MTEKEIFGLLGQKVSCPGCLELDVVLDDTAKGRVIGYTTGNAVIHTGMAWFDHVSESDIAAHWIHEYMHVLGFEHSHRRSRQWPFTVPYALGNVAIFALKRLADPTAPDVQTLFMGIGLDQPKAQQPLPNELLVSPLDEPEVTVLPEDAKFPMPGNDGEELPEDEECLLAITAPSLDDDHVLKAADVSSAIGTGSVALPSANQDVLLALLASRLREVTARFVADQIAKALPATPKPTRELFQQILVPAIRGATPAQSAQMVANALLRYGLTLRIAIGIESGWLGKIETPDGEQACHGANLVNAVYESLAATSGSSKQRFPSSTGRIRHECKDIADKLQTLVKWSGSLPLEPKAIKDLVTHNTTAGTGVPGKCTGAVLGDLAPQVRVAVNGLTDGSVKPLRALFTLRNALRSERNTDLDRASDCATALAQFSNDYDRWLSNVTPDALMLDDGDFKTMADELEKVEASAARARIAAMIHLLGTGRKVTARDVADLIQEGRSTLTEQVPNRTLRKIVDGLLVDASFALRDAPESALGVELDPKALGRGALARIRDDRRDGLYLRATIGAGVFYSTHVHASYPQSGLVLYEELGGGYRFRAGEVLHGPHAIVSAAGFTLLSPRNGLARHVLVGGGWSVNLYRVLDISLSGGYAIDLDGGKGGVVGIGGLQLPLPDYLEALDNAVSQ